MPVFCFTEPPGNAAKDNFIKERHLEEGGVFFISG